MQDEKRKMHYSVPCLEKIPFISHGFGSRYFNKQLPSKNIQGKKPKCVFLDQIHSDIIHAVAELPDKNWKGDALLTDRPGFLLTVRTADCLPVLLVDKKKKVVAALHCGWRGTKKKLAEKAVKAMSALYKCERSSLLAALGPCIEQDCYEVGEEVRESFKDAGIRDDFFLSSAAKKGSYYFDLKQANRYQLLKAGLKPENIFSVDLCTYCEESLFSYRRDGFKAGRMVNFIGLLY
jgi:YfiH family protein